ncbi:MAG: hypothetical protein VB877_03705 [Pirellulaceae bacterium]
MQTYYRWRPKYGGMNITDGCLVHLKGLTKLKELSLANTHPKPGAITDAGVAKLQKALPNCSIYR